MGFNGDNRRDQNPGSWDWDFFFAILRNLGIMSAFVLFGLVFFKMKGSRCNVPSPSVEIGHSHILQDEDFGNSEQTRVPQILRERVKNQSKNVSQTDAESVKKDEKKAIDTNEKKKENDTFLNQSKNVSQTDAESVKKDEKKAIDTNENKKENDTFLGKLIKQKKRFLNEIKKKRVARTGITDEIALWHDMWEIVYLLSSLPQTPRYGSFYAMDGHLSGPWEKEKFFDYYYPETYRYRRKDALSKMNFDPRRFWPAKDSFTQGTLRLKLECRPPILIIVDSNQRSFPRRG